MRMLLHILSLNPAAPAYQDEALKRARISRQDRPAHSSSDYLSFSIQKNKKKLQIVDKVAYNYNYINDKLLDSLWGEVQFTKRMQVDHRLNTRPGLPGSELKKGFSYSKKQTNMMQMGLAEIMQWLAYRLWLVVPRDGERTRPSAS